jgi:hypothetical protein
VAGAVGGKEQELFSRKLHKLAQIKSKRLFRLRAKTRVRDFTRDMKDTKKSKSLFRLRAKTRVRDFTRDMKDTKKSKRAKAYLG